MPRTARTKLLTALAVKRYAEGPATTKELHDGGGLYLRRREGGAYWYLRTTDPATGATQWHRMFPDDPQGGYPHKSLANARDEAERLWSLRSQGLDPRAERRRLIEQRKQEEEAARLDAARRLTVRQLFDRWRETELQPRLRADGKRTGRKDGGQYVFEQFGRHVFPTIGEIALENLRKTELLSVLDAQVSAGKLRTANVLLADLKQMLDFALERELIVANPLATVKKGKVGGPAVERERALSEDEIKKLATQLPSAKLHLRAETAIWLILATAVRVGELMGAVWGDDLPTDARKRTARLDDLSKQAEAAGVKLGVVDLGSRQWYLPQTKNQRDHTVHLSDFALGRLRTLAEMRETLPGDDDGAMSPWVFPATDARNPVCVKSFGKQLADRQRGTEQRLKNRTKATTTLALPGGKWTAHDLRRTAATIMARLGFGTDVINECLNHMQQDRMAKVYIRDRREDAQARAFDALGERLGMLLGSAEDSGSQA
jgi:integrase